MDRTLTDFYIQEATEYIDKLFEALEEDPGEEGMDRIRRRPPKSRPSCAA